MIFWEGGEVFWTVNHGHGAHPERMKMGSTGEGAGPTPVTFARQERGSFLTGLTGLTGFFE